MLSGLYGFMVIEGENDVAQALPGTKEQFLLLAESLVDNSTKFAEPVFPIVFSFDWQHVTNGEIGLNKTFDYEVGDLVLFRAASASVEPTMHLTLENHTVTILARDGYTLAEPETVETLILAAGQRVEFVVKFEQAGSFVWRRAPWDAGVKGAEACLAVFGADVDTCVSYDIPQIVGTINVADTDTPSDATIPTSLRPTPYYLLERASRQATNDRTITLQVTQQFPLFQVPYDGPFVPPGFGFGMDDRFFTPLYSHGEILADSCETWTVVNDPSTFEHSFHTHAVPFLVTHENGEALDTPFWTDTHYMPAGLANFSAHICFDGLQNGDQLMVHCHMPTHQDIGVS
jgi:FtsP/CotA-like multicopper oxidase with cupredoxin domain